MKNLKPRIKPLIRSALAPVVTERKWSKAGRARVLQRDGYLCQVCLQEDRITPAAEVDHIVPLHLGGMDTDNNKQSICLPCHLIKSKADELARLCVQRSGSSQ